MTTQEAVTLGLVILNQYPDCEICAEHDQIWAGPENIKLISKEDMKYLKSYGWFVDEDSLSIFV